MIDAWRDIFRTATRLRREDGTYLLPTKGLQALAEAMERDDSQLLQGATCVPPPVMAMAKLPVEGACLLGFCGWKGMCLETVGDVDRFFADAFRAVDDGRADTWRLMGDWDSRPRADVFRDYLEETRRALAERGEAETVV